MGINHLVTIGVNYDSMTALALWDTITGCTEIKDL